MKKLSKSDWRCTGRYCLTTRGACCPQRDSCVRYLSLMRFDYDSGVPDYHDIPVLMAKPGCNEMMPVTVENEEDYQFAIDQIEKLLSDYNLNVESVEVLAKAVAKYEREMIETAKNWATDCQPQENNLVKTGNHFHY